MNQIALPEGTIYPHSIVEQDGVTYFLCKLHAGGARRLGIIGAATGLVGAEPGGAAQLYPCSAENAVALRERLVLLHNQLPAYISRTQYEHNLARLQANRARADAIGAQRQGPSLLTALVVCGKCGWRMTVRYSGADNRHTYLCSHSGRTMAMKLGLTNNQSYDKTCLELVLPIYQYYEVI